MRNIEKGSLLISEPSSIEQTFFKSIILITHHDKDESIGLILNQTTKIKLHDLLDNIPISDFPVSYGGPVEKNALQFIHILGNIIPNTKKISDKLFWGGDFEKVLELIRCGKISKNEIRFFVGYSGWGEEQLINEVIENSWIIHEFKTSICMQYSDQNLWSDLIKTKKKKYAIWANMPKNPSLN